MSELKVVHAFDVYEAYTKTGDDDAAQVYIKSEADKAIAELKAQKAQAEDDCAYWKTMAQKNAEDNSVMAKQRAEAFERECHQKYKRCLAMANVCAEKLYRQNLTTYGYEFYCKWLRRWLAIAEKFKEAK